MRALTELKEMLEDDVKKITKKGDISPDELNNVYKAIDIIKDIETIKAMRDSGYSQEGSYGSYNNMSNGRSYNSYDGSYNSYNSYARRGRDGDGDGRYSENRGSYEYSRHENREQMIQKLEMMMQNAQNEEQRKAIKRCIDEL